VVSAANRTAPHRLSDAAFGLNPTYESANVFVIPLKVGMMKSVGRVQQRSRAPDILTGC